MVGRARRIRRRGWEATDAFLDGYGVERSDLLDAYVLDKALYEVVYEAGNRPDWLGIPLGAVDRLLAHGKPPAPDGDEPVPG